MHVGHVCSFSALVSARTAMAHLEPNLSRCDSSLALPSSFW
ncbi:hypothetical protein FM119_02850 [Mycetocola reblochoni REB411]|uniref:Uncharacterized protein n=1 Tax=Mycetocola reblochoni REB411 TaxID=1255698 RepID=A0A1R4INW9_9MICO|nr:hypothetical protein FM119_02850 [Mycetocola reblochoni REB411]